MTEWQLQDAKNKFSAVPVSSAMRAPICSLPPRRWSLALTVVTRNVRHFEPAGVPVLDPSSIAAT